LATDGLLRRHPIAAYIALALVLPTPILLLRYFDLPFEPILIWASWTPNMAAFLVLGLVLREAGGIRKLVSGWGKWRVGVRWYVAAISPLLVAFLAAGILLALGGRRTEPAGPVIGRLLMSFVLSIVTGALGEELGWRGFLLPRLQQRFNALTSGLIAGVVWAAWHLPLWALPGYGWDAIPYWSFALGAISLSVLLTWVLNNTGGSLLLASLMHLMMNYGMGAAGILGLLPSPADYWVVASVLFVAYAGVVVALAGPRTLSRGRGDEWWGGAASHSLRQE
jgi:membrane protease YdiL (CAAX protease family)